MPLVRGLRHVLAHGPVFLGNPDGLGGSGEGRIAGDALMIRRALSNLLSNALRHTPRGGTVSIAVDATRPEQTLIRVENSGTAIAAEHLPRLFDRFYRVDTARIRATGCSGLGLAIVKALVDAHQGRIEVESTPGEGSTFTVYIPLEAAEKPRITNLMPVLKD